jgi:hypothetical protein
MKKTKEKLESDYLQFTNYFESAELSATKKIWVQRLWF